MATTIEMFFGILILSFIVERFFEIISSVLEYAVGRTGSKIWFVYTDLDEKKVKEFEPIKRLIFTPLGLVVGWFLVSVTDVSILHDTNLLTATTPFARNLDKLLTAVAISWGTGPIHNFIGSIEKYKKGSKEDGKE